MVVRSLASSCANANIIRLIFLSRRGITLSNAPTLANPLHQDRAFFLTRHPPARTPRFQAHVQEHG
jgi:hypothetical protein